MTTDCIDCLHRTLSNTEEPCKSCVPGWMNGYKPLFAPAVITDEPKCTGNCVECTHRSCQIDEGKDAPDNDCNTCRYEEVDANEDPCCNCVGGSEWKFDTFPDEPGDCPFLDAEDAPESDAVDHPGHYTRLPIETIKAIKLIVTEVYGEEGFKAHCFATELKYRLRAGFKGDALEDIGKALKYEQFRKNNFE